MDENRVQGTLRNATGKMQEELGRATRDYSTQAKGQLNQVAGTVQKVYGETKDVTRETATSLDKWLRHTMTTKPYTTALVVFGAGWLLGRMRSSL